MIIKQIKFILLITVIIVSSLLISCNNNTEPQVCISGTCVNVEIAEDDYDRNLGLMFRESLEENSGMLFVFETEGEHNFWMKNTLIPLDMIWINEDKVIVYIAEAEPCEVMECPTFAPGKDAKYVLEVNKGYSKEHNFNVGDKVKFKDI